jgi:hypothetical protein
VTQRRQGAEAAECADATDILRQSGHAPASGIGVRLRAGAVSCVSALR